MFGGFSMRVSSGKELNRNLLACSLTESGLTGIPQATDFDAIDKDSMFLGVIVVELCVFQRVTLTSACYADLWNFKHRRFQNFGWTEIEPRSLENEIVLIN